MRESGWTSDVFLLEDESVLKVPRGPDARRKVSKEVHLLSVLGERDSLLVPQCLDCCVDGDTGGVLWARYTRVHGRPIETGQLWAPWAVASVARLLSALHTVPTDTVSGIVDSFGPERIGAYLDWITGTLTVEDKGVDSLSQRAVDCLRTLTAMTDWPEVRLVHGDLSRKHVFSVGLDRLAVIDWCEARLGDACMDFAWLAQAGEDVFWNVLEQYEGPTAISYHRASVWCVFYQLELLRCAVAGADRRKATLALRETLHRVTVG